MTNVTTKNLLIIYNNLRGDKNDFKNGKCNKAL